ncbi:hypothetical protein KKA94_03360 [Patescibacteria group bacterium]|nr:hypothetical protein [Patescibacteria group bacterium]
MADRQAQVYLFQHEFDQSQATKLPYGFQTRFETQLVLEDELIAESNWLNSGNLPIERQKAKEYGEAIGKELVERSVLEYVLHLNERYDGLPCAHPSRSDVSFLSSEFDKAIRAQLESSR